MKGITNVKLKARFFDFFLFFSSLFIAIYSAPLTVPVSSYLIALLMFWLFSTVYYRFKIITRSGTTAIEYGISYTWSFGVFTGPLGVFIFEFLYALTIYLYKKRTKKADPHEGLDMLYNIGSYALNGSICYFLFHWLYPLLEPYAFGYWLLMPLLTVLATLLANINLIITFSLSGEEDMIRNAKNMLKYGNLLDIGKVAITNTMLLFCLMEREWGMLLSLFLLNYVVSLSFYSKSQSIQDKHERDKFEQMAYRDFLTGAYNRAFMDQKMDELDRSDEIIGLVVMDIDNFKKINDSYNHTVGDGIIRHFANTLFSRLGPQDFLFRSGGEEFTVILRNRTYGQCMDWAEITVGSLENTLVDVEYGDRSIRVGYTASAGLYYFPVGKPDLMEKGYVQADHLLLKSKRLGRNRVSSQNAVIEEPF
ncbi:Diguanylate cyclase DosC [compost metagenome]